MYSMLVPCRTIGTITPKRNDSSRALLINNVLITFTPTEYVLLVLLLDGALVADATLLQALCRGSATYRRKRARRTMLQTLKKHMENAKSKLRESGLYICRVHGYGYSLVAVPTGTPVTRSA